MKLRLFLSRAEKQECPRRAEGPMITEPPDYWRRTKKESWPKGIKKPRTCSFCGCIHPEDAITLVRDSNFTVESTTKNYKWYLNPPHGQVAPSFKLYRQHTTQEQRETLSNIILEKRRTVRERGETGRRASLRN